MREKGRRNVRTDRVFFVVFVFCFFCVCFFGLSCVVFCGFSFVFFCGFWWFFVVLGGFFLACFFFFKNLPAVQRHTPNEGQRVCLPTAIASRWVPGCGGRKMPHPTTCVHALPHLPLASHTTRNGQISTDDSGGAMNSRRGQHKLLGSGMIYEQANEPTSNQNKHRRKTNNAMFFCSFAFFVLFFSRFLFCFVFPFFFFLVSSKDPREQPIQGRSWARQDRFPT